MNYELLISLFAVAVSVLAAIYARQSISEAKKSKRDRKSCK